MLGCRGRHGELHTADYVGGPLCYVTCIQDLHMTCCLDASLPCPTPSLTTQASFLGCCRWLFRSSINSRPFVQLLPLPEAHDQLKGSRQSPGTVTVGSQSGSGRPHARSTPTHILREMERERLEGDLDRDASHRYVCCCMVGQAVQIERLCRAKCGPTPVAVQHDGAMPGMHMPSSFGSLCLMPMQGSLATFA